VYITVSVMQGHTINKSYAIFPAGFVIEIKFFLRKTSVQKGKKLWVR